MCEMNIGDWIQAIIAFLILLTVFVSMWNIFLQRKYIRSNTRPWVYLEYKNELSIQNDMVIIPTSLYNVGKSPAKEVFMIMIMTTNDDHYPSNELKKHFQQQMMSIDKTIIFPNQKPLTGWNSIIYVPSEPNVDIRNFLLKKTHYLHTYLTYKSQDNERFHLKHTLKMTVLSDFKIILNFVNSDMKPL